MRDDFARFRRYAKSLPSRFYKALLRCTLYLEGKVEEEAPVLTSDLVNSISSYAVNRGARSYGVVTITSNHAGFVIEGTGIYGPRGSPIVPVKKKALAFFYHGLKVVVRSVKGQRPNPFHKRAFRKALPKMNEIIGRVLR